MALKINIDLDYQSVESDSHEGAPIYKTYPKLTVDMEFDVEILEFLRRNAGGTFDAMMNAVMHTSSEIAKQVQIS